MTGFDAHADPSGNIAGRRPIGPEKCPSREPCECPARADRAAPTHEPECAGGISTGDSLSGGRAQWGRRLAATGAPTSRSGGRSTPDVPAYPVFLPVEAGLLGRRDGPVMSGRKVPLLHTDPVIGAMQSSGLGAGEITLPHFLSDAPVLSGEPPVDLLATGMLLGPRAICQGGNAGAGDEGGQKDSDEFGKPSVHKWSSMRC